MPTVVKIPLVGPVDRRKAVVAGGLTAGVVVILYVWHKRTAAATAATTTSDPALGSDLPGNVPYSNPNPGAVGGGTAVSGDGVQTNADWFDNAVTKMTTLGYDPQFAAVVCSKILSGTPLTDTEMQAAQVALGAAGAPPQGYPPLRSATPATVPPPPPPATGGTTPTPGPKPGPARRYVITVAYHTPHPDWRSYLDGIAAHAGRSVGQLQSWNSISNANVIGTGVTIWVDPPGNYNGSKRIG